MSGENRLRVVFLNHWARRLGGAEYSLLDILLEAAGHFECHLITTEEGPLTERAASNGIEVHIVACSSKLEAIRRGNLVESLLHGWTALIAYLRYLLGLRRLVRRLSPGLIHANVPKSHMALFFLQRFGYRGSGCVHLREIFSRSSLALWLYRFGSRHAQCHIVAISHHVKESLPSGMHKRCTVLHNGIAIPHAVRHPRATAPLRMVYLGRVVPWKGCEMLIRMVDTARRSMHADVELDIVGGTLYWSQEYRRELRDMIDRLELSGCCKLSEHTEQIGEVFSSHHLFCNASLQEPFGRSVAEAQAWGLPVVAFRSGGTEEIVVDGKSGYLVEPGDVGALAEAVMRFVRDPALIEIMGEFARKRAMEKFNREKQLGTCMELLRGMIIASD